MSISMPSFADWKGSMSNTYGGLRSPYRRVQDGGSPYRWVQDGGSPYRRVQDGGYPCRRVQDGGNLCRGYARWQRMARWKDMSDVDKERKRRAYEIHKQWWEDVRGYG